MVPSRAVWVDGREGLPRLRLVTRGSHEADPLTLLTLDGGVNAQDVDVLGGAVDRAIHSDHETLVAVDSQLVTIRRFLDLSLNRPTLDRRQGAAVGRDLIEERGLRPGRSRRSTTR